MHLLWHHIVGPKFQLIVDSGVVLPKPYEEDGVPACIWFARDSFWDKKADRPWTNHPTDRYYRINRDEAAVFGLGRIGVRPWIVAYDQWEFDRLLGRGVLDSVFPPVSEIKCWNFSLDTRISVDPVASAKWHAVQVWQDSTWVDVPFEKRDC